MANKTIGVCTSAEGSNIEGLLIFLRKESGNQVVFVELPYNDLDNYWLEPLKYDGLILCHSINNRRFAITDVLDALYDVFLPRSNQVCGKGNICVIVHDFPWPLGGQTGDHVRIKEGHMESFQVRQPTTFKCSDVAMICGRLSENEDDNRSIEMDEEDKRKLLNFLTNVDKQPISSRLRYLAVFIIALLFSLIPFPIIMNIVGALLAVLGCYVCMPMGHHLGRKLKGGHVKELWYDLSHIIWSFILLIFSLPGCFCASAVQLVISTLGTLGVLPRKCFLVLTELASSVLNKVFSLLPIYFKSGLEKRLEQWKDVTKQALASVHQVCSRSYSITSLKLRDWTMPATKVCTSALRFFPSCVENFLIEVKDEILLKAICKPPPIRTGFVRLAYWWCMLWVMLCWCAARFAVKKIIRV